MPNRYFHDLYHRNYLDMLRRQQIEEAEKKKNPGSRQVAEQVYQGNTIKLMNDLRMGASLEDEILDEL